MRTVKVTVIEGKGKTGKASKGKKRFLFSNGFAEFDSLCSKVYKHYQKQYPTGKLTRHDLYQQIQKSVLKYRDAEIMDYEFDCVGINLKVFNVSRLSKVAYLDIDNFINRN